MKETLGSKFKRAWNIFMNRDPTSYQAASTSALVMGIDPTEFV